MAAGAKIAAVAAFWIAIGLVQVFNWGHGVEKAAVMLLLLAAMPFILAATRSAAATQPPRWATRLVTFAACVFLGLEIVYLGLRILHPHLIDIATTTLAAGDALLHGTNPYAAPIDFGPEAQGYSGYKYLPVMIAAYLPLGQLAGERGVLLTNLLLFLACLWLMRHLARSALAPFLFLMLPIVPEQIFAKGATDLVAVLPLLAGFALMERSPFVAGLCLGLSIAAKPLPGVLFLPCLLPAVRRWHYLGGVALGMSPLLPFLLWSPADLFANLVQFNLSRPPDSTSWMQGASAASIAVAHAALLAAFLGACLYCWRKAPPLPMRWGIGAMLTLAAILTGPGAHHNYQLWWLPFYALTMGVALACNEACEATSLRYTSAIGTDAKGSIGNG